jgi:hypothetical protein
MDFGISLHVFYLVFISQSSENINRWLQVKAKIKICTLDTKVGPSAWHGVFQFKGGRDGLQLCRVALIY